MFSYRNKVIMIAHEKIKGVSEKYGNQTETVKKYLRWNILLKHKGRPGTQPDRIYRPVESRTWQGQRVFPNKLDSVSRSVAFG
jgi:hypothetical protein